MKLFTPEQYADLVASEVDAAHHAKTGEMLNFGRYRALLVRHFRTAITASLEQAISTVHAAEKAEEEDVAAHIRKHIPKE